MRSAVLVLMILLMGGCTNVAQMQRKYLEGDESQLDKLMEIVSRPDYPYATRRKAAKALGEIGDRRAVPVLIATLHGYEQRNTLRLEPLGIGEGVVFDTEITGSTLPREYYRPIEIGAREAAANGVLAGYPVTDVKIVLTDGSHHEVDSSEMAFNVAGSMAFKAAAQRASMALLEPIMKLEVITPAEFLGDVLADLNSRRAQIQNMEGQNETQVVNAFVPLAETFRYATDLRSRTTGRASFVMSLDHYDKAPRHIADEIAGGAK